VESARLPRFSKQIIAIWQIAPHRKRMLSTELNNPAAIPYFLWDEPMTVAEFKQRLQTASVPEQRRLLAKLLREARDTDVWLFTTPQEVWRL
jgi:hypothetical protein